MKKSDSGPHLNALTALLDEIGLNIFSKKL